MHLLQPSFASNPDAMCTDGDGYMGLFRTEDAPIVDGPNRSVIGKMPPEAEGSMSSVFFSGFLLQECFV
jgi:hypothetical protein